MQLKNISTYIPTYLKEIQSGIQFQKKKQIHSQQKLSGKDLRFTFCDLNDLNVRPFGNLFMSLNLPIGIAQTTQYRGFLQGTSLVKLADTTKIIVVDIPKDSYGEMVDGKSIELVIPIKDASKPNITSYTCYGTFLGFNPDLNNQVSDQNTVSSVFGVEPNFDNDFNTNIAYLYSNEIATPIDSFSRTVIEPSNLFIKVDGDGGVFTSPFPIPLARDNTYKTSLIGFDGLVVEYNIGTMENPVFLPLSTVTLPNSILEGGVFKPSTTIIGFRVTNKTKAQVTLTASFSLLKPVSNSVWDKWTPSNKYPYTIDGSGKRFASLSDFKNGILLDEPVGIVYLDKGIIALTHPDIIKNIDTSKFFSDTIVPVGGESNQITSISGAYTFTGVYEPNVINVPPKTYLSFNSVSTKFVQSFTCLALQDEFFQTDNPTFSLVYPPSNPDNENIYLTELGLYNAAGELVAIAKTSKPVIKNKNNVAVFRVSITT